MATIIKEYSIIFKSSKGRCLLITPKITNKKLEYLNEFHLSTFDLEAIKKVMKVLNLKSSNISYMLKENRDTIARLLKGWMPKNDGWYKEKNNKIKKDIMILLNEIVQKALIENKNL